MTVQAFGGAKIALLCDDRLLVYQRDDKPGIPWPGLWDLPGGGRENGETPLQCVQRETQEEFGVAIAECRDWRRRYDGILPGSPPTGLWPARSPRRRSPPFASAMKASAGR